MMLGENHPAEIGIESHQHRIDRYSVGEHVSVICGWERLRDPFHIMTGVGQSFRDATRYILIDEDPH